MESIVPTLSAEIIPLLLAIKSECASKGSIRNAVSIFNSIMSKDRHLSRIEKEDGSNVYQYKGYLIIVTEYIVDNIFVRSVHVIRDVNYLKNEAKHISQYLWGGDFIAKDLL